MNINDTNFGINIQDEGVGTRLRISILKQMLTRPLIKKNITAFKNALKNEKLLYRGSELSVSSLILDLEISMKKLKDILSHLTVEDYINKTTIGNEHIIFLGKKVKAKNLLIGINIELNPSPVYVLLKLSDSPLIFPHKQKSVDHETNNEFQKSKIYSRKPVSKNVFPEGRF